MIQPDLLHSHSVQIATRQPTSTLIRMNNSRELETLFAQDQADRHPLPNQSIDWTIVQPRDQARLTRVKEIYTANGLQTGADYYYAAMILQHGKTPDDYLLAHEFCIVAVSKGEHRAKWLAAASEDRFLLSIGRPQRFGTQSIMTQSNPQLQKSPIAPGITNHLRHQLNVPALELPQP